MRRAGPGGRPQRATAAPQEGWRGAFCASGYPYDAPPVASVAMDRGWHFQRTPGGTYESSLKSMDRGGKASGLEGSSNSSAGVPSPGDSDAQSTPKSRSDRDCMSAPGPERPSELIAMHAPRPTSTRAGAPSPKSDPYYDRRVVSSPSARYAGSPSLRNPSSPSIQRSPSYYQYGPAQPPAHWLRDDVTYARPAPPRHPLLTQMISDVGSGGSGGGGGFWSRGGSIPLMYCSYVENETGTAAVPIGCWLRAA